MRRESADETATRLGCSVAYIAIHNRDHRCFDGQLYTRPPCLLTDADRHDELHQWMSTIPPTTQETDR